MGDRPTLHPASWRPFLNAWGTVTNHDNNTNKEEEEEEKGLIFHTIIYWEKVNVKKKKKCDPWEGEGEDFLTLTEILNFLHLSLVNKMMELLPSIPFLKHNIPQNQKYQYKIRNCVNPFVLSPSDISGKKIWTWKSITTTYVSQFLPFSRETNRGLSFFVSLPVRSRRRAVGAPARTCRGGRAANQRGRHAWGKQ
jgi:hypothetical protein